MREWLRQLSLGNSWVECHRFHEISVHLSMAVEFPTMVVVVAVAVVAAVTVAVFVVWEARTSLAVGIVSEHNTHADTDRNTRHIGDCASKTQMLAKLDLEIVTADLDIHKLKYIDLEFLLVSHMMAVQLETKTNNKLIKHVFRVSNSYRFTPESVHISEKYLH